MKRDSDRTAPAATGRQRPGPAARAAAVSSRNGNA